MKTQDVAYEMTPAGMAALLEDYADTYGGADRLALLLYAKLPAPVWSDVVRALSADILLALQDGTP